MGTELKNIRLQIDPDPRLAAAAGGAVRYLGGEAGLEELRLAELQAAVVAACKLEFGQVRGDHAHLDVTLTRFADRIEVSLCHEGKEAGTPVAREGIDRVECEQRGECAVTRLTKYVGGEERSGV